MAYDMDSDFKWFIDNQKQLVQKYSGKILAIRNKSVLGAYDSYPQAVEKTNYPMGEYLLQVCTPGEDAYTIHIYTPGVLV